MTGLRREGDYDSRPDTERHIARVRELLIEVTSELLTRAILHDRSKLESPEVEAFNEFTPLLSATTYDSEEYKAATAAMGPALAHHYAANRHHPQHFEDGVEGMTLVDLVEMLCDWKAASERHADGDISRSIHVSGDRFDIANQLSSILQNTAIELGWM